MKKNLSLVFAILLALSWYISFDTYYGVPKEFEEHMEQAEAYEKKEIYEDAISEYEKAQACLQNRDIDIDLKIAADYLSMDEENDYVNKMESIIDSYETNEKAVIELCDYYVKNDKVSKAVQILRKENEKQPDNQKINEALDGLKGTYTTIYATYLEMTRIQAGYAAVRTQDGWGIIDSDGTALINTVYEKAGVFGEKIELAPLCKNGNWFYVNSDEHKKLVPDEKYEFLDTFSEGMAVACLDGKYGYLDDALEQQCKFEYESVSSFFNHVAAVKKDGKWAIINDKFQFITDFQYENVAMDEFGYCSIGERIFVKRDGKYQIIDLEGNVISDLKFDDAYPFMQDGQLAAVKNGDKWGFVNKNGELCIDYRYENAKSFTLEFAPVQLMDCWGYIDPKDKMVIPCQFDDATEFYKDGTAAVKSVDQWHMIKLNIYQ
ncbi:MAG: WG repeat-containing protein [Lachnospiraceae bacterium]|nr:WG repeat-containing protein [Lachnospiraceae bacterium]